MLLKTKLIVSGAISLAALYGTVCGVKTINFEGINTSSSQIEQNQKVIEKTTSTMEQADQVISKLTEKVSRQRNWDKELTKKNHDKQKKIDSLEEENERLRVKLGYVN